MFAFCSYLSPFLFIPLILYFLYSQQ
uniref:Uncharacterized protein n=1 Tax=Rhizophora mucronata TaxID=61149 RepID=A0A2P2J2L8_RHIMU